MLATSFSPDNTMVVTAICSRARNSSTSMPVMRGMLMSRTRMSTSMVAQPLHGGDGVGGGLGAVASQCQELADAAAVNGVVVEYEYLRLELLGHWWSVESDLVRPHTSTRTHIDSGRDGRERTNRFASR
jgi:hypothetical protein